MCSMAEHYYRETSSGQRLLVTEDQWNVDRFDKNYRQIIAQPGLTIYKVQECMPRLAFMEAYE